jgi:polyferredoxin
MPLVSLIIVLVVVGLLMYLINAFIPLDPTIKRILNIAVVIFLIIWLIQALGLLGPIGNLRIGR